MMTVTVNADSVDEICGGYRTHLFCHHELVKEGRRGSKLKVEDGDGNYVVVVVTEGINFDGLLKNSKYLTNGTALVIFTPETYEKVFV